MGLYKSGSSGGPPPPRKPTLGQQFLNQFATPPQPTVKVTTPRPRVVVRQGASHTGLHLTLTLLTCGLWLPVWIVIAFGGSIWNALMRMLRR